MARLRKPVLRLALAAALALGFLQAALGQVASPVSFAKVILNDKYLADGIAAGDFDRDGKADIVAGPYIYAGPDFKAKREFYPPGVFWDGKGVPQGEPSNSLFSFVQDYNRDGWPDILVQGRAHLHSPYWYENPKGAAGHWKKHLVFERIWGENPQLVDIDADGRREILMNWGGKVGLLKPDADPYKAWAFTGISEAGPWFNFTHGVGAGDVNGDGRDDFIQPDFWWEQPAPGTAGAWKSAVTEFRNANPSNGDGGAQIFAYDVDGDGDKDVISSLDAHHWGLAWFENAKANGKITWTRHMIMGNRSEEAKYGVAFSQPHALELADVDGDGLMDIVTGKRRWAHGPNGDVEPGAAPVVYWFRLVRESGKAPAYRPYRVDDASGLGLQITVTDVNGDGAADILTASKLGAFLFLNQSRPNRIRLGPPGRRAHSLFHGALPAESRAWTALGRLADRQVKLCFRVWNPSKALPPRHLSETIPTP